MSLSERETEWYKRQMMLEGWGVSAQEKLKSSTVFIAGSGGLGAPVSLYLAAAGAGHLKICDCDRVELSNLNRQILHGPSRLGLNKAESARMTLEGLNPHVKVTVLRAEITEKNVDDLVGDAGIIMDCLDNFPTRYVLNASAIRKGIPFVYGGIYGLEGRMAFFKVPQTPCFSCLCPEGPPKGIFPVVGAVPGVIGALQALEAIKYLTGIGENLKGKLLSWNGATGEFKTINISKNPSCTVCAI